MVEDDYQLMSQKDIAKLKKEIQALRKGGKAGGLAVVLDSIDKMNESIGSLTDIFREATMELKLSDHDNDSKRLRELEDKVDNLAEQNEKIAEAILTIADMSKEIKVEVMGLKDRDDSVSIPPPSDDFSNPFGSPPPGQPLPPPVTPPPMSPRPMDMQQQGMPPGPMPGQQQGGLPPLQPPPFNPQQGAPAPKKPLFGFK